MCTFAELHCLPTGRTAFLKVPMSIILTCKSVAYIITHVHNELLDGFMGGGGGAASLGHTSKIHVPSDHSTKIGLVEPGTFGTPWTGHPCSVCSGNWAGSSFDFLLLKHANRTLGTSMCCSHFIFLFCGRLSHSSKFTFHATPRNSGFLQKLNLQNLVTYDSLQLFAFACSYSPSPDPLLRATPNPCKNY
jgi:hypothetical protein